MGKHKVLLNVKDCFYLQHVQKSANPTYNSSMGGDTSSRGSRGHGDGGARTRGRVGYLLVDPVQEECDPSHDGGGSGQTSLYAPGHDPDGVVVVSVLEDDAAPAVSVTRGVYRR